MHLITRASGQAKYDHGFSLDKPESKLLFNVAKWQKNKKSAYIFSKYLLRLIWKESGSNNNLSSEEHLKKIEIKYMIIIIFIFISFHHHH